MALQPDFADALYNRGNALAELNRQEEALAAYEQVLALAPDHPSALSGLANAALTIGDWKRTAELAPLLAADVLAGKSVIQPFVLMGYHDDNELQLRCSQNYVRQAGPGRSRRCGTASATTTTGFASPICRPISTSMSPPP